MHLALQASILRMEKRVMKREEEGLERVAKGGGILNRDAIEARVDESVRFLSVAYYPAYLIAPP